MTEGHNAQMWITPVQAGESFEVGGEEQIAVEDCVIMTVPLPEGSDSAALQLVIDAPTAFKLGKDLATAVGRLIKRRVDDKGRPLSMGARLAALAEEPSPLPPSVPEEPEAIVMPGAWSARTEDVEQWKKNQEELTRIDFDPESSTEVEEPVSFSRGAFGGPKMRHSHFTRTMKTDGSCPECNDYFDRHGIPEEEQ